MEPTEAAVAMEMLVALEMLAPGFCKEFAGKLGEPYSSLDAQAVEPNEHADMLLCLIRGADKCPFELAELKQATAYMFGFYPRDGMGEPQPDYIGDPEFCVLVWQTNLVWRNKFAVWQKLFGNYDQDTYKFIGCWQKDQQ